jgi:hypothetical protein
MPVNSMRPLKLFLITCIIATKGWAICDTLKIPLNRQFFHDKINKSQSQLDLIDTKKDNFIKIAQNNEINLFVTDALGRKIDLIQNWIETPQEYLNNNDKIALLNFIDNALSKIYFSLKRKQINPSDIKSIIEIIDTAIKQPLRDVYVTKALNNSNYKSAVLINDIFFGDNANKDVDNIIYLKFCQLYPDKIIATIKNYKDEIFVDSLLHVFAQQNPSSLYTYAQSINSIEGKIIQKSQDHLVKTIAALSERPLALYYFPFLDDILKDQNTIGIINHIIGDGEKSFDSVAYYKLLVKTEVAYFTRMTSNLKDTPIAMFGPNGLREVIKKTAIRHFINPINNLHEENNLDVRMKAIDSLSAEELYFMLVLGENDIYTSSFKHSFNRLLLKMPQNPRFDSLFLHVKFDFFKKFIKMAASYNKLDSVLKYIPEQSAQYLMKAFVSNLDKSDNLEDATDVADSYSSISNKNILNRIVENILENEKKCIDNNNQKGQIIYNLLKTIFLSLDPANKINLSVIANIPSIYEIEKQTLQNDSGQVIQQVFFYGDEDGKAYFPAFINSFNSKEWKTTNYPEWVSIKSIKGKVLIFANKPLDFNENLDDSAQLHLKKYLEKNNLEPSIVVHRGHSYWLQGTINRMSENAKIVVIGSCGGYKNLNKILEISPDAHIISTKEIGAGDINKPILNYINQSLILGKPIVWKVMWETLSKQFSTDPNNTIKESWESYIPPYRNLGAIFIKAYNKKMESM